jgi:hypothetical protein
MKKILISAFLLLGSFSMASAELGVRVGLSGNMGVFTAVGSENENGTIRRSNGVEKGEMLGAMGSVFGELNLGFLPGPSALFSRISLGYDHVVHEIKTGTQSNVRCAGLNNSAQCGDLQGKTRGNHIITPATNSVSATIDNINTMYVLVNVTDWLYVRGGTIEADITTTEDLDTGSAYGNMNISGDVYGAGVHFRNDAGFFMRAEYNTTSLDGGTLTSTTNADNSVTLDGIDGDTARISVGKSF